MGQTVFQMNEEKTPKRVLEIKIDAKRRRGKHVEALSTWWKEMP